MRVVGSLTTVPRPSPTSACHVYLLHPNAPKSHLCMPRTLGNEMFEKREECYFARTTKRTYVTGQREQHLCTHYLRYGWATKACKFMGRRGHMAHRKHAGRQSGALTERLKNEDRVPTGTGGAEEGSPPPGTRRPVTERSDSAPSSGRSRHAPGAGTPGKRLRGPQ